MDNNEGSRIIIRQMVDLLRNMDASTYSAPLETFNGTSIGQHFRHIIDFYHCLLRMAEAGQVDYANRKRSPELEQSPQAAIDALEGIAAAVADLPHAKPLEILSDFSSQPDAERHPLPSSVGRELMYAFDHALHHLALVRIGLAAHYPDIRVSPELGIAPSTLKYRKTAANEKN